jgi:hypothetical protein
MIDEHMATTRNPRKCASSTPNIGFGKRMGNALVKRREGFTRVEGKYSHSETDYCRAAARSPARDHLDLQTALRKNLSAATAGVNDVLGASSRLTAASCRPILLKAKTPRSMSRECVASFLVLAPNIPNGATRRGAAMADEKDRGKQISVRLEPELQAAVEEAARREHRNMSAQVRHWIAIAVQPEQHEAAA